LWRWCHAEAEELQHRSLAQIERMERQRVRFLFVMPFHALTWANSSNQGDSTVDVASGASWSTLGTATSA
jgi:hypothetical protein